MSVPVAGLERELERTCPCGGTCHHSQSPCSLGCWAAVERMDVITVPDYRGLIERLAAMTGFGFPSTMAAVNAYDDLSTEATRLLAALSETPR